MIIRFFGNRSVALARLDVTRAEMLSTSPPSSSTWSSNPNIEYFRPPRVTRLSSTDLIIFGVIPFGSTMLSIWASSFASISCSSDTSWCLLEPALPV